MRRCRHGRTVSSSTNPASRTFGRRASTQSRCIRYWARMCDCSRSPSGTLGRPRSAPPYCRGWATTKSTTSPCFRAPAYLEMALAAAREILGETAEVRDVRFEQMLLLEEKTPVAASATVTSPGVVRFAVEAEQEGERARRASAVLHAGRAEDHPPAHDIAALLARTPAPGRRRRAEAGVRQARSAVRPGFQRTGGRVDRRRRRRHRARRGRPAAVDPVSTDRLQRPPGAARRLLPVGRRPPRDPGGRHRRPDAAAGRSPVADARAGPRRPLLLLARDPAPTPPGSRPTSNCWTSTARWCVAVEGLQIGSGTSESANRQRLLNERLLTIEWQQRELPEPPQTATLETGC